MSENKPPLPTASAVLDPGAWSGVASDQITLDCDGRHRRRIVLIADNGTRFLLDLEESRLLAGGSALRLDDGRLVEVVARPEPLLEIRASNSAALLRLAWHIGNRHLSAQICADHILIRRDHVIAEMLHGLGAIVKPVQAPFDPEGGAYGDAHRGHHHDQPDHHGPHGHDR